MTNRNKHLALELPIRGSWNHLEIQQNPNIYQTNDDLVVFSWVFSSSNSGWDYWAIFPNNLYIVIISKFWGFQIAPHWEIAHNISFFSSFAHPTSSPSSRFRQQTDLQSIITSSIFRAQRTPSWGNSNQFHFVDGRCSQPKKNTCLFQVFATRVLILPAKIPSKKMFKPYTAQALGRWWSV